MVRRKRRRKSPPDHLSRAKAYDIDGLELKRGDTVTTLTGDLTGKISDIAADDGAYFVCLKPVHRATASGEWHAADRVQRLTRHAG